MPENRIDDVRVEAHEDGASTVAPNMATTCCRPTIIVWPVGRRSSGMMMPSVLRDHRGK